MWMIELARNTITAERRIGNHSEVTGTIQAPPAPKGAMTARGCILREPGTVQQIKAH
jgi:hypothetical protein